MRLDSDIPLKASATTPIAQGPDENTLNAFISTGGEEGAIAQDILEVGRDLNALHKRLCTFLSELDRRA